MLMDTTGIFGTAPQDQKLDPSGKFEYLETSTKAPSNGWCEKTLRGCLITKHP